MNLRSEFWWKTPSKGMVLFDKGFDLSQSSWHMRNVWWKAHGNQSSQITSARRRNAPEWSCSSSKRKLAKATIPMQWFRICSRRMTVTFDFMKLPLSTLTHSSMLYQKLLWEYNFGIHDFIHVSGKATMPTWNESNAAKGEDVLVFISISYILHGSNFTLLLLR